MTKRSKAMAKWTGGGRRSLLAAALLLGTCAGALAQPRAVIELFTSQGCSSCPPADRMMADWAKDDSLIALSLPVDYWDYLGWKDTLARHGFSERQRAYSEARGDHTVYTPQVVVDGVLHAVGSNAGEVDRAIDAAAARAGVLSVPVTIAPTPTGFDISLGATALKGEVWVAPVEKAAQVVIERGENTGKTVTYTNVVRDLRKLGDYDGASRVLSLSRNQVSAPGSDSFVILVQAGDGTRPGAVLGAARHMD